MKPYIGMMVLFWYDDTRYPAVVIAVEDDRHVDLQVFGACVVEWPTDVARYEEGKNPNFTWELTRPEYEKEPKPTH